ncbi:MULTISPECIES: hypothetical protein [Thalassospira]|uniref:hypothetical protein n=1 Tax=Thalassospira TaxID=168934 RepID=UPI00080FE93C|nr:MULTISPECIES: hypothetical protein [Thalassospira]OCK08644.1 hypothetical protein KO164_2823 [Thalassospira sp. KO164]SEE54059.1 hypothetical protein SAMN04515623_2852 [Thalassospira permensis]
MWFSKADQVIPIAGAALGGIIIGVIARNGFVEWTGETLIAGLLGLGGGYFALIAARHTQQHKENKAAYRFVCQVDFVAVPVLQATENLLPKLRKMQECFGGHHNIEKPDIFQYLEKQILTKLPEPKETAPVSLQIAYDQLMFATRIHFNPVKDEQGDMTVDTVVESLEVITNRLNNLIIKSKEIRDKLAPF